MSVRKNISKNVQDSEVLRLIVVAGKCPNLVGQNCLNWPDIKTVSSDKLSEWKNEYRSMQKIFNRELTAITTFRLSLKYRREKMHYFFFISDGAHMLLKEL